MKRTILTGLGTLLLASSAWAQAPVDPVATPLAAAPPNLREAASVIKWKADFTYETLKTGTSTLVCYDRSGQPGQRPFSLECTGKGNLPRVAQNMKLEAAGGGDRAKVQALLDAAEKDGSRVKPEFGSVFYNLNGADKEHANPHTTVAVPGATAATLGLPDNGRGGGAWIMNPGTTTAHLMIPGQ